MAAENAGLLIRKGYVMSARRSGNGRKASKRKAEAGALFDPIKFLETAASGRVISTHPKKATIFAQGDDADAVFYIRKGNVKVCVLSKEG